MVQSSKIFYLAIVFVSLSTKSFSQRTDTLRYESSKGETDFWGFVLKIIHFDSTKTKDTTFFYRMGSSSNLYKVDLSLKKGVPVGYGYSYYETGQIFEKVKFGQNPSKAKFSHSRCIGGSDIYNRLNDYTIGYIYYKKYYKNGNLQSCLIKNEDYRCESNKKLYWYYNNGNLYRISIHKKGRSKEVEFFPDGKIHYSIKSGKCRNKSISYTYSADPNKKICKSVNRKKKWLITNHYYNQNFKLTKIEVYKSGKLIKEKEYSP